MKIIIAGAGKIGRGFIAQLCYPVSQEIVFAEKNQHLVHKLNEEQSYTVHIMGTEKNNSTINNYKAINLDNPKAFAKEWKDSSLLFTAIGGKNLQELGQFLAEAFKWLIQEKERLTAYNLITCENWKSPGKELKEAILKNLNENDQLFFQEIIGVTESVVMRTAVNPPKEAPADTLDVWVQDFWDLPVDRSRFIGTIPTIDHVSFINNFGDFLERKIYTNNTSNATIAYLGYLKGYVYTSDAAQDNQIEEILDNVREEVNEMLIAEQGIERKVQIEFSRKAKKKYADPTIVDPLSRHAADPIRKLGPDDRLIAPARLCLKHGIQPKAISKTIAAALYFGEPNDHDAMSLKRLRQAHGIPYILKNTCGLSEEESLYSIILEAISDLKKRGWIH
ncbi:hypothetical protein NP439_20345 [Oceanobacillus jeddahense]|uniref:Mannitol-1-phosphate 5-dehydrogenase n=1 Tax=Oceanobacillus jeddahense TaxID=1462527 RepID=A0ABY5JT62_9BACI|nr:hypothetical protein [Oceanobacillus jeddahense]UUI02363.1 hypothetical protein NP439_20345 [Oceanobacillus jeddahense]